VSSKPRKTATKEQKQWMKENGYTEKQMDAFWLDNIDTNWIIRNLNNNGMTWKDMNMSCVMNLPTQKERDLEAIKKKEEEERQKMEAEAKAKVEKEYYEEHFEEIMVEKILNGEKLTEREIQELVLDYEVDREEGDNRRWTRSVTSIVQLCDKYFSIDWEQGLTECQENEYYNQPYEVVKHTYEKTITVTEWVTAED
jgi:hypothetical protein